MYSTKEKLNYHRQLLNPLAAEADLALLHEKAPNGTNFTRYDLAPSKNAEDILFELLGVCDHDTIVRNRREFFAAKEAEEDVDNAVDNSETDSDTELSDEIPMEQQNEVPAPEGEKATGSNEETATEQTEEIQTEIPADEAQAQETVTPKPATEKKSRSPKKKSTPK